MEITRKVVVENDKLKSLIKVKEELVEKAKAIQTEIDSKVEETTKLTLKIKRLDDKVQPIYKAEAEKIKLGEFEEHSQIHLEGEELQFEIIDIEGLFKKQYIAKKEELLKKKEDANTNTDKDVDTKLDKKA